MYQARKDGSLWGWGTGANGQLNNSVNITRSSPTQIGTDTEWLFASSTNTAGALKTDGTLWMFGAATNGALGDGQASLSKNSPIQLGEANWTAFATGSTNQYCLGIKNDGTLWGWGQNSNFCYGNNSNISASSPVQVDANTDWLGGQIAASISSAFIRKSDGTLWCTGVNTNGVLGLGSTGNRSSWTQIGTNSNWTQVSCNGNNAYGLKNDGTLWAWGTNAVGQLGFNDLTNRNSPVQVGNGTDWAAVCGANQLAYAIKKDGSLWGWGLNTSGQLGTGNVLGYSSPVQTLLADKNWINLAAGNNGVVAYRYNTAFITPTPTPTPT
jgi:alpha-tubulin suppressor-like RCC1 family protein